VLILNSIGNAYSITYMSPLPWTQISLFPSWTLIFFKLKSQFPNCNLKNLSCPGGEDLGLWSVLLSTSRVRILLVPFMCWASPPPLVDNWIAVLRLVGPWVGYCILKKKKPKFNESNLQFPKVHESQIFLSISNVRDSWRIANPSQKFKYQFTSRIACQLTFISFMLWECSFSLLFILFLQYFVW
jgi:hypothetical protein